MPEKTIGLDLAKYVLTKMPDYQDAGPDFPDVQVAFPQQPLDPSTYFVLRSGDFASRLALRAYVQALRLMLDLDAIKESLTPLEKAHLFRLADGAEELADKWDYNPHKIPD